MPVRGTIKCSAEPSRMGACIKRRTKAYLVDHQNKKATATKGK